MRSIIQHIFFALILVAALSSCRKVVNNIPLARTDDMAIMQGFLNPDADTITIALSVASGVAKDKKTISLTDLKQAAVTIEGNGLSKPLQVLKANQNNIIFYLKKTEMPIVPGATYTVRAGNGDKFSLEATTTVPSAAFDFDFETQGPISSPSDGDIYRVKTTVTFDRGAMRFCRVDIATELYDMKLNYTDYYAADETVAATTLNSTLEIPAFDPDSTTYILSVSNISEDYYKFVQSMNLVEHADGNPFAEPARLYTNVKGGAGVLGSMTVQYKELW